MTKHFFADNYFSAKLTSTNFLFEYFVWYQLVDKNQLVEYKFNSLRLITGIHVDCILPCRRNVYLLLDAPCFSLLSHVGNDFHFGTRAIQS